MVEKMSKEDEDLFYDLERESKEFDKDAEIDRNLLMLNMLRDLS